MNNSVARTLAAKMLPILTGNKDADVKQAFSNAQCTQQSNCYDCGVYTIAFMRALASRAVAQETLHDANALESLSKECTPQKVSNLRQLIQNKWIEACKTSS
jgi:Ulp1 family protease